MSRPDRERAWACDRTALTKRQLADTYQRGNVGAAATVAAARGDDLGLHHPHHHRHSASARNSLRVTDDRIFKCHALQIVLLKPIIRHFKCGEHFEVPWIARDVSGVDINPDGFHEPVLSPRSKRAYFSLVHLC